MPSHLLNLCTGCTTVKVNYTFCIIEKDQTKCTKIVQNNFKNMNKVHYNK